MMIRSNQFDILRIEAIDILKTGVLPCKVEGKCVRNKYETIMNKYHNKDINLLFKNRDKELIECLDTIIEDMNLECGLDKNIEGYILFIGENDYTFYSDKFIENILTQSYIEFKKEQEDVLNIGFI